MIADNILSELYLTPIDKLIKLYLNNFRTGLRSICVLLPLMGVTWIFGLLSVNKETVVFQYIFAILNSLQVSLLRIIWAVSKPTFGHVRPEKI